MVYAILFVFGNNKVGKRFAFSIRYKLICVYTLIREGKMKQNVLITAASSGIDLSRLKHSDPLFLCVYTFI